MAYRFKGRATGQDPTGYAYANWASGQDIEIIADTREDANAKVPTILGKHPSWGNWKQHGWVWRWSSIEEIQEVDWRVQYPEFAEWLEGKAESND